MNLQKELLIQLNGQVSFAAMLVTIQSFKALSHSRESILSELEQLRQKVEDDKEDKVLELMDIVSGHCTPDKTIW